LPTFIFAEFEHPLDWGSGQATDQVEALYRYRDPLEQILIAHGCRSMSPKGRRLLAVLENNKGLGVVCEYLKKMGLLTEKGKDAPVKIAVHVGDACQGPSGWFGPEFDHAHRVLDSAPWGHPILSERASESLPVPEGFHRMSLGMHFLKDLRPPEELSTLVPEGRLTMDFPIPQSLGAYRQNLPVQPTPFLGRHEELQDLEKRLRDPGVRLITLLGPGGFGKTRLALQTAANLVDKFDGVFFVALAPLASEDRINAALGGALGLVFYGQDDPLDKIREYLKGRKSLLIFDNLEHLPGARAYIQRILEDTEVRVLATTRESLRLPEETIFEVGGLKYPESADSPLFEEASAYQLFQFHRSHDGGPIALGLEEKAAFIGLCRELHGMPLGLEMASALAQDIPLGEITARVHEHVDLLHSSLPHLPDRQKSVRAVFEYSWNLIDPGLRRSLARLSVFRGAFDIRAARRVAGCGETELKRLADRSLLAVRGVGFYQLHEMVRYYAKERLYEEPKERRAAFSNHSRHFLAFLQSKLQPFESKDQRRHLDATAAALDNIRGAVDWAMENGHLDWVDRALEAYGLFFDRRALYREGREAVQRILDGILEPGLEAKGPDFAPALFARLLTWKAFLGCRMGVVEESEKDLLHAFDLLGEAVPQGPRGGAATRVRLTVATQRDWAFSQVVLGQALEITSRVREAQDRYRRALALYQEAGDLSGQATARNRLGQSLQVAGRYDEAEVLIRPALKYYEKEGNPSGLAWSHMLLGMVELHHGRYEESKRGFRLALEEYLSVGNRDGVGWALVMLGQAARVLGEYAGSDQMLREALGIETEISNRAAIAWIRLHLGETSWHQGRFGESKVEFQKSLEIYRAIGDKGGASEAIQWLGNLSLVRGDPDKAEEYFKRAMDEIGPMLEDNRGAWQAFHEAQVALLRSDLPVARERILWAIRVFGKCDNVLGLGWGTHLKGEIEVLEGRGDAATADFAASLRVALLKGLRPMILENWLGWATLLVQRKRPLEALEWVEAVIQHPSCSGPTQLKGEAVRRELSRNLNSEERDYARRAAVAADLAGWSAKIISEAPGDEKPKRAKAKPPVKKAPKPKKR